MYLLHQDFVSGISSDLIDGAGNKSKQCPSSQPDPLFLNPDLCADDMTSPIPIDPHPFQT